MRRRLRGGRCRSIDKYAAATIFFSLFSSPSLPDCTPLVAIDIIDHSDRLTVHSPTRPSSSSQRSRLPKRTGEMIPRQLLKIKWSVTRGLSSTSTRQCNTTRDRSVLRTERVHTQQANGTSIKQSLIFTGDENLSIIFSSHLLVFRIESDWCSLLV